MRCSRSNDASGDEGLRLPRAPGMFRRFWARHPLTADLLLALLCFIITATSTIGVVDESTTAAAESSTLDNPLIIACIGAASVALLWRRRAPLIVFAVSVAVAAVFLVSGHPNAPLALAVACYSIAVYRSRRAAWVAPTIALLALSTFAVLLIAFGELRADTGMTIVGSSLLLGLIATLVGVNVAERQRYLLAVIDRSRQILSERDQQAQLAASAERARIAREMHDIVSHSLTVIVALSEGASATPDLEKARAASADAASTARAALTEMRSMLGILRKTDESAPLTPFDGPTPRDTVTTAQRAGFPVTLSVTGPDEMPTAVAHAVSRIVQEGITNAMRHARTATSIRVRISREEHAVTVEIINDGISQATEPAGFGLRGLSERVSHMHGSIEFGPCGAGRWMLLAVLPLAAESATPAGLGAAAAAGSTTPRSSTAETSGSTAETSSSTAQTSGERP